MCLVSKDKGTVSLGTFPASPGPTLHIVADECVVPGSDWTLEMALPSEFEPQEPRKRPRVTAHACNGGGRGMSWDSVSLAYLVTSEPERPYLKRQSR